VDGPLEPLQFLAEAVVPLPLPTGEPGPKIDVLPALQVGDPALTVRAGRLNRAGLLERLVRLQVDQIEALVLPAGLFLGAESLPLLEAPVTAEVGRRNQRQQSAGGPGLGQALLPVVAGPDRPPVEERHPGPVVPAVANLDQDVHELGHPAIEVVLVGVADEQVEALFRIPGGGHGHLWYGWGRRSPSRNCLVMSSGRAEEKRSPLRMTSSALRWSAGGARTLAFYPRARADQLAGRLDGGCVIRARVESQDYPDDGFFR